MTSTEGKKDAEEGSSMLPTLLAGAGILIVAGLMIFWPDSSTQTAKQAGSQSAAQAGGAKGASTAQAGGVPAREADEAQGRPAPKYKVNQRLQPATQFGMSQNPPPSEPPEFNDADEELEYWRTQLSEAKRVLEMREKAVERLPQIKEQIMAGNDPEGGLQAFEKREKVIYENIDKQKAKVKEIEEKLGALEEKAGL